MIFWNIVISKKSKMNQYFTTVDIPDNGWRISYNDRLMLIGSCFTENIGDKFNSIKFNIDINPFGIIYNPSSIAKSLDRLIEGKPYVIEDLVEHQEQWHSFDHHSRFSGNTADEALKKMNERLTHSGEFLRNATHLIITFGTAWLWERKTTGEIVSNCHKFPASNYKRIRLTPGEIIEIYRETLTKLWKFNHEVKVMFTISPVRYMKDGAWENQLSKSTLQLVVYRLLSGFGNERCFYFPAYEIMMDELRDYRFYAPDLIHPNQTAIDHIWEKFTKRFMNEKTLNLSRQITKILKAKSHKPFNKNTEAYKKFISSTLEDVNNIIISFPYLNIEEEKQYFENELLNNWKKL